MLQDGSAASGEVVDLHIYSASALQVGSTRKESHKADSFQPLFKNKSAIQSARTCLASRAALAASTGSQSDESKTSQQKPLYFHAGGSILPVEGKDCNL